MRKPGAIYIVAMASSPVRNGTGCDVGGGAASGGESFASVGPAA
jgi:hypothetical protein